ncbi:MAG: carboxypeptidase M32 [bacterium]
MTTSEALAALDRLEERKFAFDHAMGILYYDGSTAAPRRSALPRGRTMGILSEEVYRLSTGPETVALIDLLRERAAELNPAQLRRVALWEKSLRELRAIPMEDYVAFEALLPNAEAAWQEAKARDEYALFAPYLEKIVAYRRRFAACAAPGKDPFDYCLDTYEEGLTAEKCDSFFAALRERIVPLVDYLRDAEQPDEAVSRVRFPVARQRELSRRVMGLLGLDPARCVLGETEHPYTTNFTPDDVRITTHYREDRFLTSLYSVIHEGGHALYELGIDPAYSFTCLSGGVSMGIHESQSRFFENIIGRSRPFLTHLWPTLTELAPELTAFSPEDLFRCANRAQPGLIRTEADELTYSLHIMVRYEMERAMLRGEVSVTELPAAWNALYEKYLGLRPTSDREGVLQDTHWAGGAIGYFPSYALGSAYGAQLLHRMEETVDVWGAVAKGDFSPISGWLREKIWQFGSLKTPQELLANALGDDFSPVYYLDYLEKKIKDVYDL